MHWGWRLPAPNGILWIKTFFGPEFRQESNLDQPEPPFCPYYQEAIGHFIGDTASFANAEARPLVYESARRSCCPIGNHEYAEARTLGGDDAQTVSPWVSCKFLESEANLRFCARIIFTQSPSLVPSRLWIVRSGIGLVEVGLRIE